ncbi:MAG: hypothetical protein KAR20_18065 [Candidatus Heimdallarchaeota archaeon]|nr:hypothetical protein [Candidatus Heimdallarchaeota archaeon]
MKLSDSIWVIFDPLDGPHVFNSKKKAKKTYKKWKKDAKEDVGYDSFNEVSKPIEYSRI